MNTPFYGTQYLARVKQEIIPSGQTSKLKLLGAGGRKWQPECFYQGRLQPNFWFSAFMGSGKSLEMLYLAVDELIRSQGRQKQIVLFPYLFLQKSFRTCDLGFTASGDPATPLTPESDIRIWKWNLEADRNLCVPTSITESVIDDLIQAIIEPLDAYESRWDERDLWGRVLLTTDLAMALALDRMTPEQWEIAVGNHPDFGITYNKDEAHRILMPGAKIEEEEYDESDNEGPSSEEKQIKLAGNKLGVFFSKVVQSRHGHVRMDSGTFIRGDQKRTILGGYEGYFGEPYEQDFVEYYKSLGVEAFQMTSHVYKNEPRVPELFAFLREKIAEFKRLGKKWMLMIPHRNKGWRKEGGFDASTRYGVTPLFDLLHEFYPDEGERKSVFDFVDIRERETGRKILLNEPEDGDTKESQVDGLVGVDSLSIGVDWPECSVVINTVNDQSMIQLIQKPGRAFRKFHKKTTIEIYSCIPEFIPKDGMNPHDVMSDFTNQILAHFFIKDLFSPLEFTGVDGMKVRLRDYWRKGGKYNEVCTAIVEKIKELELLEITGVELDEYRLKPDVTVEGILPRIEDIVKDYAPEFPEPELRQVARAFVNRIVSTRRCDLTKAKPGGGHEPKMLNTSDASFIREEGGLDFVEDFDKVPLKSLGLFNAGNLTAKQLQQVREVIQTHYQWDSKYDKVVALFGRHSNIKHYLADRLQDGEQIEWSRCDVSEENEELMRWAVDQQRQALAGKLEPKQTTKMAELFFVEPPQLTRVVLPAVTPVFRRPSFGKKLVQNAVDIPTSSGV